MGEAKRRMKTVEIGARIIRSEDGGSVHLLTREVITIGQLEERALAILGEPITPAEAFVFERREQRMKGGLSRPIMIKVHPDPRVQQVLYELREAEIEKAYAEVKAQEESQGHETRVISIYNPEIRDNAY